jgi:hypothetical protein
MGLPCFCRLPVSRLLYAETNEGSKRAAAENLGSQIFPELSPEMTPPVAFGFVN